MINFSGDFFQHNAARLHPQSLPKTLVFCIGAFIT